MRDQHPLDDLFAHALRDAEATPSGAVWEGIQQKRGWAHLTLLRLRRRWGWVALVLLLGGSAAYQGMSLDTSGQDPTERFLALGDRIPTEMVGAGPVFGSGPEQAASKTCFDTTIPPALAPGRQNTDKSMIFTGRPQVVDEEASAIVERNLPPTAATSRPIEVYDNEVGRSEKPSGSGSTWSLSVRTGSDPFADGPSTSETPDATFKGKFSPNRSPAALGGTDRLPVRWSSVTQRPSAALPQSMPGSSYAGPQVAWWVAATVAVYHETRTWHGQDEQLNRALQQTETPHEATGLGALFGMERRGGWNLAFGVEYLSARYDFEHVDQFRSQEDSLVPFVITFNSQVLASYVDTISTFKEVSNAVAAVNRYSVVRFPVEGGWHRAYRRWHFGARAGLGFEFNTLRSGVTLVRENGGTRSVDISDEQRRTSMLLSGSLAADVGYAFSERWALWVSPTVSGCLVPLSAKDETPYASTERFGLRLRLAYTLRQHP